ncbi:hypothetical protein G6514_003055 [Epicoccum nigrum]|nr:hypothetical protein G6514_003055 [Epicoccum nigrum]
MSRLVHLHSAHGKVEHLQDFASLGWCQALLSDPSIPQIEERSASNERTDVSNSFFKKAPFTDEAIRANLSTCRASKAKREHDKKSMFTGSAPTASAGAQAVKAESPLLDKQEYVWSQTDPDTPEMLLLVSIGPEVD